MLLEMLLFHDAQALMQAEQGSADFKAASTRA
jgi:hypothetical protein